MDVKIHHSSSIGNLYQVDNLLIDPGVPIGEIKNRMNYRLYDVVGCLCGHGHSDHSRGVPGLLKCGVDVFMSQGTAQEMGLNGHHRLHMIKSKEVFSIGSWKILPFNTIHSAKEPLGFLITKGNEKVLYVCDSLYIPYRFEGLTAIMIECNHDREILKRNIRNKTVDLELAKNIIRGHMSIQTVKRFFETNYMPHVEEIHLLHLSRQNSNAEEFKRQIQAVTGKPVYVAKE